MLQTRMNNIKFRTEGVITPFSTLCNQERNVGTEVNGIKLVIAWLEIREVRRIVR